MFNKLPQRLVIGNLRDNVSATGFLLCERTQMIQKAALQDKHLLQQGRMNLTGEDANAVGRSKAKRQPT
jgi:hypothetical protein